MELSNKAIRYADKLIQKAKQEKDKKGYRENLGYEFDIKLKDFLSDLSLPYRQEVKVMQYFYKQCDSI